MMISNPLLAKYLMSAICFALLSSAERISTEASGMNKDLPLYLFVHLVAPVVVAALRHAYAIFLLLLATGYKNQSCGQYNTYDINQCQSRFSWNIGQFKKDTPSESEINKILSHLKICDHMPTR